ncbi:unnamed protein product [Blepharisma stoltei]|uniref:non-specific serine/threonine protein kinase n=1 Tax=Blepharisma stoltei TaxID=1481888 RepID=A0AAU9IVL5_9CILI|nr:unnamed protein product [Blepharisma stoltei]
MNSLGVSIIEELGRGTSGVVYKVRSKNDGKFYVVKAIDLSSVSSKKSKQAQKEVEILKQLDNFHIIKYYASLIQDDTMFILMEYAALGDLNTFIKSSKEQRKTIEEGQIWTWTYEICLGIKYLHTHNIIHRDIKCLNVLLDQNRRIKIGDLGLSKISNRKELHASNVGTPLFLSPEQVRRQPYGHKVDIWGLGCIIYTLAALEVPFAGDNMITLGLNIIHSEPRPIPVKYSPKLVDFISTLLKKEPKERPGILEVINQIPIFIRKAYKKPKLPAGVLTPREALMNHKDSLFFQTIESSFFPKIGLPQIDKDSFLHKLKKLTPSDYRPSSVISKTPISHTPTFIITPEPSRLASQVSTNSKKSIIPVIRQKTTIRDLAKIL